jgi:hypothetical protein
MGIALSSEVRQCYHAWHTFMTLTSQHHSKPAAMILGGSKAPAAWFPKRTQSAAGLPVPIGQAPPLQALVDAAVVAAPVLPKLLPRPVQPLPHAAGLSMRAVQLLHLPGALVETHSSPTALSPVMHTSSSWVY